MIRLADPVYLFLLKNLPKSWMNALNAYSTGTLTIKSESEWKIVTQGYVKLVLTNSVIIIALILLSRYYLQPFFHNLFTREWLAEVIAALVTMGAMAPFIWALMAKKQHRIAYRTLWLDSKYNHGPLVTLEIFRNLLGIVFVSALLWQFFPLLPSLVGTVIIMAIVFVVFKKRLDEFYHRIEDRFISNLNEKENQPPQQRSLTPWDAHLSRIKIGTFGSFLGETLEALRWRERFGINIAFIERGNRLIYAPSRFEKLYPYDEIGVIGTDIQLQKFIQKVEAKPEEDTIPVDEKADQISLEKLVVDEKNGLRGQTIRESAIREKTKGLVVGIERGGERLLNPSSDTVFEWADVVWLVGDKHRIRELNQKKSGS
jgi:CPA2 family monovalent cation:H+ antiporter-2